jgi:ribosomal protein S1
MRNFTNFGIFVDLEEGVDGLIHISDLSWSKKIKQPAEFTKVGETIEVVVLDVDQENHRLSLGHKQLQENPKAEACFATGKYQVRVEGEFKLVDDIEFKKEIINHPSRKFLQGWIAEQGLDAVLDFIQVYRMEHGKAQTWSFEDNFKAKEYVEL